MYKQNPGRVSRIRELRGQGRTINEIAAITGYPRSSVGYYVSKYCGGKRRTRLIEPGRLPFQAGVPRPSSTVIPDYGSHRLESYLRNLELERKRGRSLVDIFKDETNGEPLTELLIENEFEKDPETLYIRLQILKDLIILEPFLDINLEHMRDWINLIISHPKGDLATK
jgi:hypothetical protein